jgi:hypothetical protein
MLQDGLLCEWKAAETQEEIIAYIGEMYRDVIRCL